MAFWIFLLHGSRPPAHRSQSRIRRIHPLARRSPAHTRHADSMGVSLSYPTQQPTPPNQSAGTSAGRRGRSYWPLTVGPLPRLSPVGQPADKRSSAWKQRRRSGDPDLLLYFAGVLAAPMTAFSIPDLFLIPRISEPFAGGTFPTKKDPLDGATRRLRANLDLAFAFSKRVSHPR